MIVAYLDFFQCGVQILYLAGHHDCSLEEARQTASTVIPSMVDDITFIDLFDSDFDSTEWLHFIMLVRKHLPTEAAILDMFIKNGVSHDSFIYKSYGY